MRVLLINYEFPPLGSGAANASWHVSCGLARRGRAVSVLTSRFRGLARCERSDGIRIERIGVWRRYADRCRPHELLSFALAAIPAALCLARRERPQATLAFFGFPSGPAAWAVKRALGVPYVVSLRNADVPRRALAENRFLQAPLKVLVRALWRAADRVVAVSAGLAGAARMIDPALAVDVIPNGVDTNVFRPAARPAQGGPVRLLYVGRLRRFKGVEELIDSLSPRREAAPAEDLLDRLHLTLVGDGPLRAELERRAARSGIGERIAFLGRLPHEQMPDVYRSADVFVFPTHAEGMSNALLEALASGLPCVVSDVEGNCELVRDGIEGLVVPPGDVAALRGAIARLAAAPDERARMASAARARALEFSWDRVVEEYERLLRDAAR